MFNNLIYIPNFFINTPFFSIIRVSITIVAIFILSFIVISITIGVIVLLSKPLEKIVKKRGQGAGAIAIWSGVHDAVVKGKKAYDNYKNSQPSNSQPSNSQPSDSKPTNTQPSNSIPTVNSSKLKIKTPLSPFLKKIQLN